MTLVRRWWPAASQPVATLEVLANSRCTVSGAGLTRTNSGQNVTLRIPVSINPATFQGAKNIYVNAFDKDGLLTHWQQLDASVPGGAVAADPVTRTVSLSWSASVSPNVKGYYVYRAEISGGPYAPLTAWPVYATSYADDTVAFGETYYYVTTAVDINDIESACSNDARICAPIHRQSRHTIRLHAVGRRLCRSFTIHPFQPR